MIIYNIFLINKLYIQLVVNRENGLEDLEQRKNIYFVSCIILIIKYIVIVFNLII